MKTLASKCVAELVGTFTLTFIGAGAICAWGTEDLGIVPIALAHGLALSIAVYATGHISGGHINPAVTIGLAVAGSFPWTDVPFYIIAQMLGAAAGAGLTKETAVAASRHTHSDVRDRRYTRTSHRTPSVTRLATTKPRYASSMAVPSSR